MEEQTEGKEEGSVEQHERRDGSSEHQERWRWGRERTSGVYGEKNLSSNCPCSCWAGVAESSLCVLRGILALL